MDRSADIDMFFAAGSTGTITEGASNAPLDISTLSGVLREAIRPGRVLSISSATVGPQGARIVYMLGPEKADPAYGVSDWYLIEIQVRSDAAPATQVMKRFLGGFLSGSGVGGPMPFTAEPLGDYAFRTAKRIFWIRGESVFANVSREIAIPKTSPRSGSSPDSAPQEDPDKMLILLARLIDQTLAASWVSSSNQQARPQPQLAQMGDVHATARKSFTIKVDNVDDTFYVKTAEFQDSTIGMLIKSPSPQGLFTFRAERPGATTVIMRVAHAKTLGTAEIAARVIVE